MLSANDLHLNGVNAHVNGKVAHLPCPSDYEPAPIDITPSKPTPRWRDQFPTYTHNINWLDSDGISHSMTLRSDILQDILNDLKLLKGMIRTAKQKHSTANPEQPGTQQERIVCKVHGVEMERRVSKRTRVIIFRIVLAMTFVSAEPSDKTNPPWHSARAFT